MTKSRRTHLSVPLDEMRRLMRVYGSTKCLRKRHSAGGEEAKADSVKRKFYRWFPDLAKRFVKDAAGFYRPRFGHEFEMRHREKLRMRDREVTSKKRTTSKMRTMRTQKRRRRLGGAESSAPGRAEAPVPAAAKVSSRAERAAALLITSASGIGDQGSKLPLSVPGYKVAPTPFWVDSSANRAAASFPMSASGGGEQEQDSKQAETLSVSDPYAAPASMGCNPVSAAPPPFAQPHLDQEWTTIEGDEFKVAQALLVSARHAASTATVGDPTAPVFRPQPRWNPEATTRSEYAQEAHDVSILADSVPLDGSFVAERGIFDDVERDFYGACPDLAASSSSSCDVARAEDAPSPPADGAALDASMAEYCEGMLASEAAFFG